MHYFNLPIYNQILVFLIISIGVWLLYLFLRNPIKKGLKLFSIFIIILMFLWVGGAYLARLLEESNPFLSLFFLKLAWTATPLLFVDLYFFIIYFINEEKKYNFLSWLVSLTGIATSLLTATSGLVVKNIKFTRGSLSIEYGKGMLPFLGVVAFYMLTSLYLLFKKYKSLEKGKRIRIQYLLLGISVFYLANLIFNIFLPLVLKIAKFYWLGDYSTIVLLLFISAAIIKHQLFGIRIAFVEVVIGGISVLLFLDIFDAESLPKILLRILFFLIFIFLGWLLAESLKKNILQQEKLALAYKRIKKSYKDLQALDKAKDEFLHIVSHQLRTPLTVLRGYLDFWATGKIKKLPKKRQEEIKKYIIVSADRLHKIIKDMLEVVDLEGGRMVIKKKIFNVEKLLKDIYEGGLEGSFKVKGLYFKIKKKTKESLEIYSDPRFLSIVLQNLLENAYKYTLRGGVSVVINKDGDFLKIIVKDTGIGLTLDDKERIFGKFIRGERAKSVEPNGTGLGLYATKKIIEILGGRISIDSEGENKGVEATIWLPLK